MELQLRLQEVAERIPLVRHRKGIAPTSRFSFHSLWR